MQWSSQCWTQGELVPSTPPSQRLTQHGPVLLVALQRALNRMGYELCMFERKHTFSWMNMINFISVCSVHRWHSNLLLRKALWRRGWTAPLPCRCRLPLSRQTGTGVRWCHFCKYIWTHQVTPALSGSRCCCQVDGKLPRSQSPLRSAVPLELAEIGTEKLRLWPTQLWAEIELVQSWCRNSVLCLTNYWANTASFCALNRSQKM